jgi:MoaD family protein
MLKVKLYAHFRDTLGSREVELEVPPEATVGEALTRLAQAYPALARYINTESDVALAQHIIPFLNDRPASVRDRLQEGDTLALLPTVVGGEA